MKRETVELLCEVSQKLSNIKILLGGLRYEQDNNDQLSCEDKLWEIHKSAKSEIKDLIDDIQVSLGKFCDCSVYDLKFNQVDKILKNINYNTLQEFNKSEEYHRKPF